MEKNTRGKTRDPKNYAKRSKKKWLEIEENGKTEKMNSLNARW